MKTLKDGSVEILKPHVAIHVRDLGESLIFYRGLFGEEPVKVRSDYAKFDLSNPPLNFTLNLASFDGPGALSHLGFQVASSDDVRAIRDQWVAAGLITREEMGTTCCYALQDKAWVRDPDGNEWEVFTLLQADVLQDDLPQTSECCGGSLASVDREFEANSRSGGDGEVVTVAEPRETACC